VTAPKTPSACIGIPNVTHSEARESSAPVGSATVIEFRKASGLPPGICSPEAA
jgi:hypothetical protein